MAKRAKNHTWTYAFEGAVEVIDYGRMVHWALFLPAALARRAEFGGGRPVRMRGRVGGPAGTDVALAWQRKDGRRYILISKALAKQLAVAPGARVHVAFDLVDAEEVVVPSEIEEAMCQEPEWRALWKALTPGRQRGAAHLVSSAKTEMTRADRAIRLFRDLEEGRMPGPPPRQRMS